MNTLEKLKKQAQKENPNHKFTWKNSGRYGMPDDHSHGKCSYCQTEIWIGIYDKNPITVEHQEKCLSVGRTIDPEGLAATTWAYCRKCGKKINQNNKNEVLKGFHSKCQDTFGGYLVLDTRKGNVQVSFFDGLEDYKASL